MAWQQNADGSTTCDKCKTTFRRPVSCSCPRITVNPTLVPYADMERLTAAATAEGMLDRLGLERLLADRVRKADREADAYQRLARRALKRGVVRQGPDGPIDGDEHATAQKWAALAESARGRGDKTARALHIVVADRERRADLERRERLAEQAIGRKSTRAVA